MDKPPERPKVDAANQPSTNDIPQPPKLRRIWAYRNLLVIALFVLIADQISKQAILASLPYPTYGAEHGAIAVIRNFFYIVHVGNTGAAWSMFSGQSLLLAIFALVTLIAIFLWRRALGLKELRSQNCFGLLCGGILGNVIDRLRCGHVIDFIDLHFGSYTYPSFNIADSGICVGVLLYLWQSLRDPH
ncbi:MAG: signal peptidase II [Opitutaceae bacterium]